MKLPNGEPLRFALVGGFVAGLLPIALYATNHLVGRGMDVMQIAASVVFSILVTLTPTAAVLFVPDPSTLEFSVEIGIVIATNALIYAFLGAILVRLANRPKQIATTLLESGLLIVVLALMLRTVGDWFFLRWLHGAVQLADLVASRPFAIRALAQVAAAAIATLVLISRIRRLRITKDGHQGRLASGRA